MLGKIVEGHNLGFEEAYGLYNQLLQENEIMIGAYLVAMQMKGYTSEELAAFAKAMRDKAGKLDIGPVADTCGTGGDNSSTINVSTASALLLSCFVRVAKHGNVSITSRSGSANVLDALGIETNITPKNAKCGISNTNFAFLMAPFYHPTLGRIMPVRKKLGIKTLFNILGPLANPANPVYQLIGVNSEKLLDEVAEALYLLNIHNGKVVYGEGLDEVNPNGKTSVAEVTRNGVERYFVTPEDFGINRTKPTSCNGPFESAKRIKAVLAGKGKEQDKNFILLNASMALSITRHEDLYECRELVESVLGDTATGKLEEIKDAYPKA